MKRDSRGHYERLAGRFEEHWAHSPAFVTWMRGCLLDRLSPEPGDRTLDLGCGTGLYSTALAETAGEVTCVDPSAAMLAQLPPGKALVPVEASLEDLAAGVVALPHKQFEVVLAKEMLHHAADRHTAVDTLASLLAPTGRLLIVLLSPSLEYPLFTAALDRYERRPADVAGLAHRLCDLGLRTEVTSDSYRLKIAKHRWLAMVGERWMSLLSNFNDDELEAGVAEIDARYSDPVLEFNDSFVFVLAYRPPHA